MERAGGWLNQYTVVKQGMISYEIATGQASTKNKPKLEVLQNVGMTRIDPVQFKGMDIVPLEFLKALLPAPDSLGQNYTGQTSIGCQIKGVKDGADRTYFIWNNCDHAETYREVRGQAVSYTTGVPAMIGAMLMLRGVWMKPGVWNCEQLDPDPFIEQMNQQGLPVQERIDIPLPHEYPV